MGAARKRSQWHFDPPPLGCLIRHSTLPQGLCAYQPSGSHPHLTPGAHTQIMNHESQEEDTNHEPASSSPCDVNPTLITGG